jgi:hypothetical protein
VFLVPLRAGTRDVPLDRFAREDGDPSAPAWESCRLGSAPSESSPKASIEPPGASKGPQSPSENFQCFPGIHNYQWLTGERRPKNCWPRGGADNGSRAAEATVLMRANAFSRSPNRFFASRVLVNPDSRLPPPDRLWGGLCDRRDARSRGLEHIMMGVFQVRRDSGTAPQKRLDLGNRNAMLLAVRPVALVPLE